MAGPIDPIDGVQPYRVTPERRGATEEQTYRRTLHGEIVAVRKHSGHHSPGHILDTTVGENAYDEVVVRVRRGDVEGIQGKRVVVHIEFDAERTR